MHFQDSFDKVMCLIFFTTIEKSARCWYKRLLDPLLQTLSSIHSTTQGEQNHLEEFGTSP